MHTGVGLGRWDFESGPVSSCTLGAFEKGEVEGAGIVNSKGHAEEADGVDGGARCNENVDGEDEGQACVVRTREQGGAR